MMLRQSLQARRLWLVALLATLLLAVQLVQASPLHQHSTHSSHSVDCTLCHLPSLDDPQAQRVVLPTRADLSALLPHSIEPDFTSVCAVPYQGRAPPVLTR